MTKEADILAGINDLTKYIDKMTIKSMYLDNDAGKIESVIDKQSGVIHELSMSSKLRVSQVKEETYALNNEVRECSARIESLIGEFKRMVKQEDFERLKAKVQSMRLEFVEQN